jgi:hypothetical protein
MKGVYVPQQEKHQFFSVKQLTLRKDMGCASGLLKKRFNILAISDQFYSHHTFELIMRACTILHNMIIDDERDGDYDEDYYIIIFIIAPLINYESPASLTRIIQRETHLTSGLKFLNLQSDLIEHV